MDVFEIRLANGRYLAEEEGGITKFAAKLEKSQGQVSHFLGKNPIKPIGTKIARQIEKKFGKAKGWMDLLHPEVLGENVISEVSAQYAAVGKSGSALLTGVTAKINTLSEPDLKELDIYVNYLLNRQLPGKKQRKTKH